MQLEKLDALARLADDLSRTSSLDEVYAVSLDCLQHSLGVERASILLFDANEVMSFVAWRGISDAYRRAVNGHTPWRPETRNPEPVLVSDAAAEPSLAGYAEVFRAAGIRALGFFALTHRDRVIGKFMLYYAEPHAFSSEEVALAKTIAGQIAFGVTRARAEQALEAERERLSATVSNVPGMVWETVGSFPGGQKVTFCSDGIRELLGYEPEDWYRDPNFWNRIIVERVDGHMDTIAANAMRDDVAALHFYKLRRRDGSVIWAEVRSTHKMVDGTLVSRGVTMDITARKLAEERNALLSEASGVLSATMDYETSLAQLADLIVGTLGDWCVIDVVEEDDVARVAVRHRDPSKAALAERLRTEFPPSKHEVGLGRRVTETNAPILLRERDGDAAMLLRTSPAAEVFEALGCESVIVVPITAAGRAFGSIAVVSASRKYSEDDLAVAVELGRRAGYAIDHARLYRHAQGANRAKDEFLATLSHELRTPMTATLGWASMLRHGDIAPDTFRLALETIERSVRAQAKLIDEIFDVSRIVTGKLQLEIAPVDLPRVIQAAVDTIQPSAAAKAQTLEVNYEHAGAPLAGDAARLQQVIWNLLSNAVKFTPPGGAIRIGVQRAADHHVEIIVRDSGPGIPKRMLPFIFERFRQGDGGATRAHGGLGLGLAIVKSIVELHGGSVTAESDGEGRGAAFTVRLPMSRGREEEVAKAARRADANVVSLSGVVVMVVEDDDDTRVMLTQTLAHSGATVIPVASAPAALEALRQHPPHVVVSDIAMPGEDGYSLIAKIRDIPVIAVTAFARPEDRERILAAGFVEHLAKPVDTTVMLQKVKTLSRSAGEGGA
jgi:PAS domain S-box-containing protein